MSIKSKISNLEENILLSVHTTFRIGGPARYFFAAKTQTDFLSAVRAAKEENLPFYLLGGGSNILASDEGFDGLVIKMQNANIKMKNDSVKCKVECDAGVSLGRIIIDTVKNGYSGVEWGFGIPGTIGGAICGNAGRLGQAIAQVVESVRVLDENLNEKEIPAAQCDFAYRESRFKKTGEIILGATLVFEKKEKSLVDQVLNEAKEVIKHSPPFPSAGCAFKNYEVLENDPLLERHPELKERMRGGKIGVGFLIDQCGLKGRQEGGARIWEGHANYIVNVGQAKAKDVLKLINICKVAVKEKFGVELEEEIRFLNG